MGARKSQASGTSCTSGSAVRRSPATCSVVTVPISRPSAIRAASSAELCPRWQGATRSPCSTTPCRRTSSRLQARSAPSMETTHTRRESTPRMFGLPLRDCLHRPCTRTAPVVLRSRNATASHARETASSGPDPAATSRRRTAPTATTEGSRSPATARSSSVAHRHPGRRRSRPRSAASIARSLPPARPARSPGHTHQ